MKLQFIAKLDSNQLGKLYPHFRNAFLASLPVDELCNTFIEQKYSLRSAILMQIYKSLHKNFLPCHRELLDRLFNLIEQQHSPDRRSAAYALNYLIDVLPEEYAISVLKYFLRSSYVSIRKYGLRRLEKKWDDRFLKDLQCVWQNYHDHLAAELIVFHGPINFLIQNLDKLDADIKYRTTRAELYERTFPDSVRLLNEWENRDVVTYVYLSVSAGIGITKRDAHRIAIKNINDNNVGILIWAFGEMGYWDVLKEMYKLMTKETAT